MVGTAPAAVPQIRPPWVKALAGALALAAVLALLAIFFPWDLLRGPLNRYVSDMTGRHFEITRKLDVKLGPTTRILADGIEFANPEWAADPHLVKAESAEIRIELLPLLERRIELPLVELRKPQLGLQVEADGRRSWALGRDTADPRNIPNIGALVVDHGSVHFIAAHHGADIHTDFAIQGPPQPPAGSGTRVPAATGTSAATTTTATAAPAGAAMPLSFKSRGTWQKEPFTAQGRTGTVLYLNAPLQRPFPLEVNATAGATTLRASGSIASLATLDGANADFNLQGRDLADLYKLVGVVLPATPRYSLHGKLSKEGKVWHVRQIDGKLGNSDLAGELSYDRARAVPLLAGTVRSRSLDFDDLAPLVGLPEQPRSAAALPHVSGARAVAPDARAARGPTRKVLPAAGLDTARLRAMDADVRYAAARISQLPLERMTVHVKLRDGVLRLDPLNLGVAGGSVAGRLRIDGTSDPAVGEAHLDVRSLELNKLFPRVTITHASLGKMHGDIDLKGRGNSVARMLGTSSGSLALLMGPGQISNLLLEVAGLDGAEIVKFLLGGDQNVTLRCAAAAFDVAGGLMNTRALVLDTTDTVIYGSGQVSLANEAIDLTLRPYPKDMSILSLRSPLVVAGTFAGPKVGPYKGALAGRAGLALALAAVHPLLALAATVETGPGQDANCGPALREAASTYAAARIAVLSRPPEPQKAFQLGGPRAAAPAAAPAASGAPAAPGGKTADQDRRAANGPDTPPHAPGVPGHLGGP
ncbi:MAG TPA: AsmA family protein [Ramlibacter sp.]|nr:AsmA family protein [Ramlibacter sp.]